MTERTKDMIEGAVLAAQVGMALVIAVGMFVVVLAIHAATP